MNRLIKLKQAVIVEGKYDKIRLENIIDAVIMTTDGFGIFKNKEKRDLIKLFAQKSGIIIMTDSDRAGQIIRKFVCDIAKNGNIINVYLPGIKGKEKRKDKASADGILGVEGIDDKVIVEALNRFGVTSETVVSSERKVTKTDFFNIGISGTDSSRKKRESLCRFLNLPEFLTANSLLEAVNSLYGYECFMEEVAKWKREETEN